jgi:hypothetical protein
MRSWAEAAHYVPDRRFVLSGRRPLKRGIASLTFAVAGSAIAVGAIASSPAPSVTSAASATGQATVGGQANAAAAPKAIGIGSNSQDAVALDAFITPVKADTKAASKRAETPRQVAWYMLGSFGWSHWQYQFLNKLWERESGWNPRAENPYSGAYGIPQAVPGSKMASAGSNWRTSARTQILWGLRYIKGRYGSPHHAWQHELAYGWY